MSWKKIHHIRHEHRIRQPGLGHVRVTSYWCGMYIRSLVDRPDEILPESAPPTPDNAHCRRCLVSMRRKKGDGYIIEHGLPLIAFPLKGVLP